MKFSISFLLALCIPLTGYSLIHIQSYSHNQGQIIKNIFLQKYKIPEKLIEIEVTNIACRKGLRGDKKSVLSLCLNKKRELILLSLDIKTLQRSFKVFSSPARTLIGTKDRIKQ